MAYRSLARSAHTLLASVPSATNLARPALAQAPASLRASRWQSQAVPGVEGEATSSPDTTQPTEPESIESAPDSSSTPQDSSASPPTSAVPDGMELNPDPCKVYVSNIPAEATREALAEALSDYGEVAATKIITDRETGESRGFAYVVFADEASAQRAIGQERPFESGMIKIARALWKKRPDPAHRGGARGPRERRDPSEYSNLPPSRVVYLGSLPFSMNARQLREMFPEASYTRLAPPKYNQRGAGNAGYGFLEFEDVEGAKIFVERCHKEGLEINQRQVRVGYSVARRDGTSSDVA